MNHRGKITTLEELARTLASLRRRGLKTALACGKAGGQTVFIDGIVFSSSSLANRFYAPLPRD